jgi:hypothetical protein
MTKSALYAAMFTVTFAVAAQASGIETGTVMVCDTQQQAERFGELFNGNAEKALAAVNKEHKDACGVADVAYVQGKPMATVRSKSHTFHVVPVIVVGVNTPSGLQPVNSAVLFSVIEVREFSI